MTTHITAAPFFVATLGIACFAVMDAVMKGLAIELGAYNAMLWRTGCGVLIVTLSIPSKASRVAAPGNH